MLCEKLYNHLCYVFTSFGFLIHVYQTQAYKWRHFANQTNPNSSRCNKACRKNIYLFYFEYMICYDHAHHDWPIKCTVCGSFNVSVSLCFKSDIKSQTPHSHGTFSWLNHQIHHVHVNKFTKPSIMINMTVVDQNCS